VPSARESAKPSIAEQRRRVRAALERERGISGTIPSRHARADSSPDESAATRQKIGKDGDHVITSVQP